MAALYPPLAAASRCTEVDLAYRAAQALRCGRPAAGRVIVNEEGYFEGTSLTTDHAACPITAGLTLDVTNAAFMAEHAAVTRYVVCAHARVQRQR
jgi:hypothetical protein